VTLMPKRFDPSAGELGSKFRNAGREAGITPDVVSPARLDN
jgi:hypothetical protein